MSLHQRKLTPNSVAEDKPSASQKTKRLGVPWWQLYSALIILIGVGEMMAANAPTLLKNPWVLLFGVFLFVGFAMVWSHKNSRELEAEPWPLLDDQNTSEDAQKEHGAQE